MIVPCPLCHGPTRRLFAKDGYWIRACRMCGHRHAELASAAGHVARVYNDGYFTGGGAGYADYVSEGELLRARGRRYARLARRHLVPGTVLDVGAAAGFLLQGFIDGGWKGKGIEPNARMAQYARVRLGLDVICLPLEDLAMTEQFDLVTLIQVVAHFVNPRLALATVAAVTRPGGLCLIETWDRDSWSARALGRRWHEYSPPSVLHWFSARGLERVLAEFGFRRLARGRPLKWILASHAKALLRHKLAGSPLARFALPALRLCPNGLAIPYPPEDLFWSLFRKS
jgi:SAM-dependent methyltransferase